MEIEDSEREIKIPANSLKDSVTISQINVSNVMIPLYVVHSQKMYWRDKIESDIINDLSINYQDEWFGTTEFEYTETTAQLREIMSTSVSVMLLILSCVSF